MKKILFSFLIGLGFLTLSSLCEARNNVVVWGGGYYMGYPAYYGYRPMPIYPPVPPVPVVPYPAYQPYYGYYPYGPIPVATGAPFIYNQGH